MAKRSMNIKRFKTGLGQTLRYESMISIRTRRIYSSPEAEPERQITAENIAMMPLIGRKV